MRPYTIWLSLGCVLVLSIGVAPAKPDAANDAGPAAKTLPGEPDTLAPLPSKTKPGDPSKTKPAAKSDAPAADPKSHAKSGPDLLSMDSHAVVVTAVGGTTGGCGCLTCGTGGCGGCGGYGSYQPHHCWNWLTYHALPCGEHCFKKRCAPQTPPLYLYFLGSCECGSPGQSFVAPHGCVGCTSCGGCGGAPAIPCASCR